MRSVSCFLLLLLLPSLIAFPQTAKPPAFDAADVHASPVSNRVPFVGGIFRGGRYDLRNATMVDLIKTAYQIDDDSKVAGGPSWLATDHFDIIAKAEPSSSPEAIRSMLQNLLVERFKLTVHKDNRPVTAYVLTAGKRPTMKEGSGSGDNGCQNKPQNAKAGEVAYNAVSCHNMTMADLAKALPNMAPAYVTGFVVDQTGLKGSWDFDLKWTPRGNLTAAGSDGITMFDAVDKQLGLKLETQKVPMAVLVVDSVNQKPTSNSPGVENEIPAAPTEFEVAVIKPSAPDAPPGGGPGFQPGGRIDVKGVTLQNIIVIAWDIPPDLIGNAPKWFNSDRFDLVARAPGGGATTDTAGGAPANLPTDIDSLRAMLRNLIIDRFKLATHKEEQSVNVYALTAPKNETKLKKADPNDRSACTRGSGPVSNPALTQSWTCQNTTMAQFASQVRSWAGGYIDHQVVDLTGLQGGWDFVLSWTPKGLLEAGGLRGVDSPRPAAAGGDTASNPSSGLTVFEAIDRQLGLKLASQKHTMSVLVIDHVEQKPVN